MRFFASSITLLCFEYSITTAVTTHNEVDKCDLNLRSLSRSTDGPGRNVDVLDHVSCRFGMSTYVCVNDCNCVCDDSTLSCPRGSSRCTLAAYKNCEEACDCVTCGGYKEHEQEVIEM
ncbi:hypothetical protein BCR34DRAFT_6778 [Clohesyomyces aquaticus]|uniref:Uncharacterized protein n=1 Tax=Clohesyomyces aquaticus TaxID=1231657 RepID=A0A1Y2ABJ7_9PLEO|nr:hypothetical protein BCR34DRAFT_6778 [Clohesyomyces aquaticus]